jgi:mannose-6-phosphate isomerase-like protein (cupin superfamily)
MRLIVALRIAFVGPGHDETSFLFLVDGAGREGLGLHHDGDVHAFWVQLEGRRTVTVGPPVPRGTPQEIADSAMRRAPFVTRALPPGSLLYLPPRTPHRVVCYERSVALSLTWSLARRDRRRAALADWDVSAGRVRTVPRASRTRVWTQVPAVANGGDSRTTTLMLPDGERVRVPRVSRAMARHLALMSSFPRGAVGRALSALEAHGIVGAQDLPAAIAPASPDALDGWRFA